MDLLNKWEDVKQTSVFYITQDYLSHEEMLVLFLAARLSKTSLFKFLS